MKKHSEWLLEINSSLKKCYGLIENPENHPKWSPYKVNVNKIDIQWLDRRWHYFFDTQHFIPDEVKIVHAVCKDFEVVWRYNEKYNL